MHFIKISNPRSSSQVRKNRFSVNWSCYGLEVCRADLLLLGHELLDVGNPRVQIQKQNSKEGYIPRHDRNSLSQAFCSGNIKLFHLK